jgi:hypothetical protein
LQLKRNIRNLAVTGITIASAIVLTVLVATGASAATGSEIYNYNSGPAGVNLCLGISGNNADAEAVQWPCATDGQTWYAGASISPGYTQIYWVRDGVHQCLGVAGGSTKPNAEVVGWSCLGTGHPDQYWFVDDSLLGGCPGFEYLINYKSGKVLGIAGNSYKAGAEAVIYGAQGACNNQQWLTSIVT